MPYTMSVIHSNTYQSAEVLLGWKYLRERMREEWPKVKSQGNLLLITVKSYFDLKCLFFFFSLAIPFLVANFLNETYFAATFVPGNDYFVISSENFPNEIFRFIS